MQNTDNTINRRNFIRLTGISTAGFMMGLSLSAKGRPVVTNMSAITERFELSPFILIEKSGLITLFNSRPEMGQGTFQAIPALIAEELELSFDQFTVKQTGGEKQFGPMQFSGGSESVRGSYMELRKLGAAAREMLITAASEEWKVPKEECYAEHGRIVHRISGKAAGYGALAEAASKLPVPKEPKLKDPKDFKLLGKSIQRLDTPLKSSGKAIFGIDIEVPGMVYASIERCPVFGAKLISYDDTASKKIKGVLRVETCERIYGIYSYEGIAVIAENYWAALQGRKALKVKWDFQGHDSFNSKNYEQGLRELAKKPGLLEMEKGDFNKAYTSAALKLEALYETPIISHSPIEPMNCVANWHDGNKLEIWASTQVPGDIVNDFPKLFDVPAENFKLNVTFNGGAFGRRLFYDFIVDAVQLSKKIGLPVKSIWTREDDTQLGPFRPMTYSAMKAGLGTDGKALAFQHKVIAPSIEASLKKEFDASKVDHDMTEGISEQKYEFENFNNRYVYAPIHIPLGYWRAVTSTTLAFAHESFIDEMAVKAKKDPLAYRLQMLTQPSDTKNVLLKLKEVSHWDKPLPKGWGRGVAVYEFFAGLCGHVVEVSKKGTGIKIEKVYSVIDMGTIVNPDTIKAQVEGAVVMGITAAIKGGISFDKGQTQQSNFHNNPILRMNETPVVEVHILANGGEKIKGAGEPGLPPLAPALCNAVFAATGKRIRRLPFDINKLV